jgi:hypothetical protein
VEGQNASVKMHAAGDNARFMFLEIIGAIVFMDITSRKAEKVYELTPEDNKELVSVHPPRRGHVWIIPLNFSPIISDV